MKITSVERSSKNNSKWVHVYIDDRYSFSILEEDYIKNALYEKSEISQDEIDYICSELNLKSARFKAIKYVALKKRTSREIILKLESLGYDEDTVHKVVCELEDRGYVSDLDYAKKFIADRMNFKPKAKKLLKIELEIKGINKEVIDDVLEKLDYDEFNTAKRLVEKRFSNIDYSNQKAVNKLCNFLRNRGFGFEIINSIVKNL